MVTNTLIRVDLTGGPFDGDWFRADRSKLVDLEVLQIQYPQVPCGAYHDYLIDREGHGSAPGTQHVVARYAGLSPALVDDLN